jgi:ERCC4-type nuclease
MLLCDHGERRSGVPAELERLGVDVYGARLPAGDYVVSDRLVVERKGPTDLAASIKDRRLFEQLARLAEAYPSEDVLRCLPGISTVGAGRLLAHFGSLERVFAARREQLLEVRGIGPVRARTLDRLFRATVPDEPVRLLAA